MITVTTNNQPRPLVAIVDIPTADQSWFDYLGADEQYVPRLVHYRGAYYDVFDSMRTEGQLTELGWHGYQHETYFSGVVFRLGDDADSVTVGRYFVGDDVS